MLYVPTYHERDAAVIVQWRVRLQAIFLTHHEVFRAMPRSRMHDPAALLERHMLAEYSGDDPIEERVLELGAGKAIALKCWRGRIEMQTRFPCDAVQEFLSQKIGISALIRREHVFVLRVKRQGHASRQGPWRRRPHQGINSILIFLIRRAIC